MNLWNRTNNPLMNQQPKPKQKRQKFDPELYERAKIRLEIARAMLRMKEFKQAKTYLHSFPEPVHDFCMMMCDNTYDEDPRPLKLLARFVIRELEYFDNPRNENGKRWDTDRQYYLNQLSKFGW